MQSVDWFKAEVAPYLHGYEVEYRFFGNGDFGDLQQVEFSSESLGGEIDFWSSGRLAIHLVDYTNGKELMNSLWEAGEQDMRRSEELQKLRRLLLCLRK